MMFLRNYVARAQSRGGGAAAHCTLWRNTASAMNIRLFLMLKFTRRLGICVTVNGDALFFDPTKF